MKITTKQKQEIDFLSIIFRDSRFGKKDFQATPEEIVEFINYTSKGIGTNLDIRNETNWLKISKRLLDISVKQWAEDMKEWLLLYTEILEDYDNHPYVIRIINSIRKQLTTKHSYDWVLSLAKIAYINTTFNFKRIIT